eukprot:COSAG04_NODE_3185_length_3078_cov_2.279624_3_plen_265_part_00
MSTMGAMRQAMRAVRPNSMFIPLVYHDNLGQAVAGGHALGARGPRGQGGLEAEGTKFAGSDFASVSFTQSDASASAGSCSLSFFYHNTLNAWLRNANGDQYLNTVVLEVSADGQQLMSTDTATTQSVALATISLASTPSNITFCVKPSAIEVTSKVDATRITYVFGVELTCAGQQGSQLGKASYRVSDPHRRGLVATATDDSVVTGVADAMIAHQTEGPSVFKSADYKALLAHVVKQCQQSSMQTQVWGGHYARMYACLHPSRS